MKMTQGETPANIVDPCAQGSVCSWNQGAGCSSLASLELDLGLGGEQRQFGFVDLGLDWAQYQIGSADKSQILFINMLCKFFQERDMWIIQRELEIWKLLVD
ncbi:hypothetical protein IGI04_000651 [Brassica rapa subsp. trilocularis]|uniref:Uncharacterized protein n=1 Tax=Brassica rapa subsp. trilocularis TaxID=1813537 RepID=A0ABQ7NTS0_BRACM|nr:hypothetical protein IGI04_000651 [Brassica rapa subsp. trilocularis]